MPRLKPSSRYITTNTINSHLIPAFGSCNPVTTEDVDRFIKRELAIGHKPSTINSRLRVLSRVLKNGVAWGHLEDKDLPTIRYMKEKRKPIQWLTNEQIKALAAHRESPWREMIILAGFTGLRIGEILALEWSDIILDDENPYVMVSKTRFRHITQSPKSDEGYRAVPLTKLVVETLESLPRHPTSDMVFFTPGTGKPISDSAAANAMPGGWHMLRHSFGANTAGLGIPVPVIQSLMGHASIDMTMRYVHLLNDQKNEAIKKLEESCV